MKQAQRKRYESEATGLEKKFIKTKLENKFFKKEEISKEIDSPGPTEGAQP